MDYIGERASIDDTLQTKSTGSAYFYFIKSIDGHAIPNAVTTSMAASYGHGFYLSALGYSREVPIKSLKIVLVAKVVHSAPIALWVDPDGNNRAEGVVEFLPVSNMKYLVKGSLSKNYSAVWIEDSSGNIVSKRIEKINLTRSGVPEEKNITNIKQPENIQLTRADMFLNVSGGEGKDSVIKKLGKPDDITEVKASILAGPPAHDITTYNYKDLGKVQFAVSRSGDLTVEKIMRNAQLGNDASSLKVKINAADGGCFAVACTRILFNRSS